MVDEAAVVAATLEPPPDRLGVTHWSTRLLAAELGISNFAVGQVWKRWGLQPWRTETFKFSTDPELEAKVRDVVGLYLDPPEKAVVLCVDEKSQIQALDRTAPILPLRPGLPEKASHDYVRHGTTTLFAALEVATGKVVDACYDRHRHQEFLRFLKQVAKSYPRRQLHVVVDNYATHKHPAVQAWLAKNKRVRLHFTPTSGSWLNLVEVFFSIITRQAIRRGTFISVHRPDRRHPPLHRRLERPLPALHLDQDRRRDPPARHRRSKNLNHAALGEAGGGQSWRRVRVHADRLQSAAVLHAVNAVQAVRGRRSRRADRSLGAAATVGPGLGQLAVQHRERAERAAVVVLLGALPGRPGQQPDLDLLGQRQPQVPALRPVEPGRQVELLRRAGREPPGQAGKVPLGPALARGQHAGERPHAGDGPVCIGKLDAVIE